MKPDRCWTIPVFAAALVLAVGAPLWAAPQIGYVYPAGGRQGTTFTVVVGGQSLRGVDDVRISGAGVRAAVGQHVRALDNEELRETSAFMRDLVRRRWSASAMAAAAQQAAEEPPLPDHPWLRDLDEKTPDELTRLWVRLFDPKKQPNAQIAEQVELEVTIVPDAAPGERELRLVAPDGLSNPLRFQAGTLPEVREDELALAGGAGTAVLDLPVLVNGQIMPGEVDRFRLRARQGQKLVIRLQARRLIPYLADAVPGWFQAAMSLYGPGGDEVAYSDDYRFDPDPVLLYEVPADGVYGLEVRDAIYRGRDDFVYRIAMGELPFVTGMFPLGAAPGTPTTATLAGWNLPATTVNLEGGPDAEAIRWVTVGGAQGLANELAYLVDDLPETAETEPNDAMSDPQQVAFPAAVNGRIGRSGDVDVFGFEGRAGQEIVAEVYARRLNSPLDSLLRLVDAAGTVLALNDDCKDPRMGLVTHHADSLLRVTLPEDGAYRVCVSDAQGQGGEAWAYRLRLRAVEPDFALRLMPSAINAPAGRSASVTVQALRREGFDGEVELALTEAPEGFTLSSARIAAGESSVQATVTAPRGAARQVAPLRIEGRAQIGGLTVSRPAVPAEDMMQAFLWRFLVPQRELLVAVTGSKRIPTVWRPLVPGVRLAEATPVRIPLGGTVQVRLEAPGTLPDSRASRLDTLRFRLSSRPRGVTLRETAVTPAGVTLTLKVDRNMAMVGDAANAIVEVYGGRGGDSLGVLPAIPVEIVRP